MNLIVQEWKKGTGIWNRWKRPDGYTIHRNIDDCNEFINEYNKKIQETLPPEYSIPDGIAIDVEFLTTHEAGAIVERLVGKTGIWILESDVLAKKIRDAIENPKYIVIL